MKAAHEPIRVNDGFVSVSCPRCGNSTGQTVLVGKDHLHGLGNDYRVCECAGCELWFLNPRPSSDRLSSFYPDDYGPHGDAEAPQRSAEMLSYLADHLGYEHLRQPAVRERAWRAPFDRARMHWKVGVALTPHFVDGGSLLEIGAASGLRLAGLRDLGWQDLRGIELVSRAAEKARARGFDVVCGAVEDCLGTFADGSLDVVVSSMVLEHLIDPFAVVRQVGAKVKSLGQFLFSTITRDSLDARLYGEYWGGFDFPRHLIYFRDRDIQAMLGDDFEIEETFHHNAPQDFQRSSQWRAHEGKWLDRAVLALTDSSLRYSAGLLLAWTGLTCRVSYRCRKKR